MDRLPPLMLPVRASTGGFVKLTPEKRAEIFRNGQVVDPITMEVLEHQGEFFEVQRPHGVSPGEQPNLYVDPEALWAHVQRQDSRGMMAGNRQRIWYEDWWALCNTYNPNHADVPYWAHTLERESQYRARVALETEMQCAAERGVGVASFECGGTHWR